MNTTASFLLANNSLPQSNVLNESSIDNSNSANDNTEQMSSEKVAKMKRWYLNFLIHFIFKTRFLKN